MSVPRTPKRLQPGAKMWAGLTYNLDAVGLDLSRSQFIELWVSDWNDHHDQGAGRVPRVRGDGAFTPSVKLHIDLGTVSEDQMRAPNRPPNRALDTEDRNKDNQPVVIGGTSEDTGVDGIDDAAEQQKLNQDPLNYKRADILPALLNPNDPEGDDWGGLVQNFPSAMDPRRYLATNGTENSHTAFPIPDTEDLNLDQILNTTERYFEYTIDLGAQNSPYLVSDVVDDCVRKPVPTPIITPVDSTRNGWRRYRIPITDSLRVRFGTPDLTIAQHVRIWIDGLTRDERPADQSENVAERPMLMIGGLDIVGSRWQTTDLTPQQRDVLKTTVTLNAVNSVDDADKYKAPFDPGETRNGNQGFTRREQSIALEFADLAPDDTLEAFRTFSIPENYSRYGTLRWFGSSFEVSADSAATGKPLGTYDPAVDKLFYFVRFASDDKGQSYYEIKRPLPPSSVALDIHWEEVLAGIERLSQVKLNPDFPVRDPILYRTLL